jgi:phospholipid-translocating ATPase
MVSTPKLDRHAWLSNLLSRHLYMVVSEIVTLAIYIISIAFLPEYFGESFHHCAHPPIHCVPDLTFVVTLGFAWKVAVIVAVSALPLYIIKAVYRRISPAASSKLL